MSPVRASKKTRDMTYIALFAVLMAVCSWISVPTAVPFTMQTFAVFLAFCLLGGRRAALAILVYLLMGAVGLPVFSNFTGGLGCLLNVTGGYLVGFLLCALLMWLMETLLGRGIRAKIASMAVGLLACYAFGTAWFMVVYARTTAAIGVGAALLMCVVPYIIPDLVKLSLALLLSKRLSPLIK